MDLLCLRCGEPWDMEFVLHEEPQSFRRKGSAISQCPSCRDKKPVLSNNQKERLHAAAVLAELLGDDVDGYAAELDDYGLL